MFFVLPFSLPLCNAFVCVSSVLPFSFSAAPQPTTSPAGSQVKKKPSKVPGIDLGNAHFRFYSLLLFFLFGPLYRFFSGLLFSSLFLLSSHCVSFPLCFFFPFFLSGPLSLCLISVSSLLAAAGPIKVAPGNPGVQPAPANAVPMSPRGTSKSKLKDMPLDLTAANAIPAADHQGPR